MHFRSDKRLGRSRNERGSVLMIALLLVLLGTFGMTAWFGLIAARSLEVNAKEAAMKRRVQLNGVKEVARQIASQTFLADDDGTLVNTQATLPGGMGAVDFAPWSGSPYVETTQTRYDQIGGVPFESYTTDLVAQIDDGGGALGVLDFGVQLRTYVPALQGDLLLLHQPGRVAPWPVTDSNLLINGRTVAWNAGSSLAHRTLRLHTSGKGTTVSLLDLAGNAVLPDNETFAGRTTGNDFAGLLKVHSSSESTLNRYTARMAGLTHVTLDGATVSDITQIPVLGYGCDGLGGVAIDLLNPALPHIHVTGNISKLELGGATTAADFTAMAGFAPVLIIADNPAGNAFGAMNIALVGECDRPVVLVVRQDAVVATPAGLITQFQIGIPFPRWRSIIELENSPLVVVNEVGVSELQIRGGIRTDAGIDTSGGIVRLLRDTATPNAAAIASRAGFVEIIRH